MALDGSSLDIKSEPNLAQHVSRSYTHLQTRDKPILAAMRRPQFQHEFTTESFNNTGVGSPSPARPLIGNSSRKGASTRSGGLSAAFRRVNEQSINNANKDEPVMESRRSDRPLYRPVVSRQQSKGSLPPESRVVPSRSTARTPSPPEIKAQDLLLSPMSEVSEASPPREFAEAYKQINDAEILAAQDEELETTDDASAILPEDNARLLHVDPALMPENPRQRLSGVDDAIILESSPLQNMQDSVHSLPPELEIDFDAANTGAVSRQEKDLRRLYATLGEAKAFSKARRRPKLGTNSSQRDDSLRSDSQSGSSNTSGSILSDGSLNIPSAWGRKARQGRTWLSHLSRDINGNENQPPMMGGLPQEDDKSQAIQNWQAEASMTPLPDVAQDDLLEHSPSPAREALPAVSARDRVRKLAFGSKESSYPGNLQGKSNPALDVIKRGETQNLSDIVVQPNDFGPLIDERLKDTRRKSVSLKPDDNMESAAELNNQFPPLQMPSRVLPHPTSEKPTFHKTRKIQENDIFDDMSEMRSGKKGISGNLSKTVAPSHDSALQNDTVQNRSQHDKHLWKDSDKIKAEEKLEPDMKIHTPVPAKSQTYLKTPLVTGAWIDTPMPTIKTERVKEEPATQESVKETLKKLGLEHLAGTSRVIQNADIKQETLQETAPRLPGSALAAIINRAKDKKAQGTTSQNDDTLLLDDSTILSLEELLANAGESDSSISDTAIKTTGSRVKTGLKSAKHRMPPARLSDQDSDSENDVGIASRLDRLKTSIHDAKAGVGSLQRRINKLPNKSTSASSSRSQSRSRAQSDCEEAGEFHDFIWPCEKCGRKGNSWSSDSGSLLEWHWRPLQIYTPQFWFWPADGKLPRLTKLGWCSVMFWLLILTEAILW